MPGIEIDASAVRALAIDLGRVGVATIPKVRQVVHATGYEVQRDAQALAPVDTGYLRSSISVSFGGGAASVYAEVGPTAEYGAFVEYGTSRMSPQPYMGPAFDRHIGRFVDAVAHAAQVGP